MPLLDLRVATLNIGGGEKTFETSLYENRQTRQDAREMLIEKMDADLLCLQEVSQHIDADGITHSMMEDLSASAGYDLSCVV